MASYRRSNLSRLSRSPFSSGGTFCWVAEAMAPPSFPTKSHRAQGRSPGNLDVGGDLPPCSYDRLPSSSRPDRIGLIDRGIADGAILDPSLGRASIPISARDGVMTDVLQAQPTLTAPGCCRKVRRIVEFTEQGCGLGEGDGVHEAPGGHGRVDADGRACACGDRGLQLAESARPRRAPAVTPQHEVERIQQISERAQAAVDWGDLRKRTGRTSIQLVDEELDPRRRPLLAAGHGPDARGAVRGSRGLLAARRWRATTIMWRPCSAWVRSRRSGATRRRRPSDSRWPSPSIPTGPGPTTCWDGFARPWARPTMLRWRPTSRRAWNSTPTTPSPIVRIAGHPARAEPARPASLFAARPAPSSCPPVDGEARSLRGLGALEAPPHPRGDRRPARRRTAAAEPAGRLLQPRPGARGRPQAGRCPFRRRESPPPRPDRLRRPRAIRATQAMIQVATHRRAALEPGADQEPRHAGCVVVSSLTELFRRRGADPPRTAPHPRGRDRSRSRPRRSGCNWAGTVGRSGGPGRLQASHG